MLTYVLPLAIYILSIPVMLATIFRVEIGILFFTTCVPVIALMKKIAELPGGNNFADYLLVAIVLGWLFGAAREDRPLFISSPLNTIVIIVCLGSLFNLIRGYTYMSLPGEINLTRLMAWKNYMILPLLYFIGANNLDTEKKVRWIIIGMLLTLLAMDFNFYSTFRWMRAEHYSDSIRIVGAFSYLGPNELGVFYSMYTMLLFGISFFIEEKKLKYAIFAVCACNMYPILFSYSRAAYISTMACLLTLGILKDRRILLAVVAIVLFYRFLLPVSVVERIDMTFLDKESVSEQAEQSSAMDIGGVEVDTVGRKELWEKAKMYFAEQPLFGIGFDTFRHKEGMITHSLYMKILAEQGLFGLAIFILFIGALLRKSYVLFKKSGSSLGRGIGLGFLLCVVTHLAGSISGDQSLYYNLMAIFWLFMGIVASFSVRFVTAGESAHDAPHVAERKMEKETVESWSHSFSGPHS
jgi:O-antigen ligase